MTSHLVLVGLRLAIVAIGALLALWSLRIGVYSRGHRETYLLMAFGFGFITLGVIVEGVLFEFAGRSLSDAHAVEAIVSAAGFALILLAIVRSRV